ncbi:MAG: hypothetical protein Q8N05_02670 [Bacteroidota bacterium]|nr:hypothetical protein [Bacteroidota bacterium]
MNKIWIAFFLVLCLAFCGCKKEPSPEFCTVEAIAGDHGVIDPSGISTLKIGDSKLYNIIPNDNYRLRSVKVKGVEQSTISSTVSVKALVPGEIIKIEVEFFHKNFYFLTEGILYLQRINIRQDGKIVDWSPREGQSYKFCTDGSFYSNGIKKAGYVWKIIDDTHFMGGDQIFVILVADDHNIVYGLDGFFNGIPAVYEYNYSRP